MEQRPIKRSKYLVALSRDHHGGLLFCWKLKQGLQNGIAIERVVAYVRFFWESHLRQHFSEEEVLLFNLVNSRFTAKALDEHVLLAEKFNSIIARNEVSQSQLLELSTNLTAHIRFEEREVFPHLEAELSSDTLSCVAELLLTLHTVPFEDNYADEFWLSDKKGGP